MLTGALLLGIGLVAAGARLYGLDAKPLWLDETLSWRLQSFPLGLLLERTGSAATVHPPLYFVILHVWTPCFGDSHFALRLPSVLFGVLSVLAIYPLTRDLAAMSFRGADAAARSRSAGLLASALVAISPYHIHAAHQARPYTLGILLAIVSTWLLLLALRARTPRRIVTAWLLYALSVLGFLYTHHLGLFSVLAQGLFAAAILFPIRRSAAAAAAEPAMWYRLARRWALVAAAVVIVGYLPWAPRVFAQSENLRTAWSRSVRPAELLQLPTSALLAAVERLLAQRRDGEPVIAQSPEMLFKLLYYSDGSFRPRLLVDAPDRQQQFCAAQLLDEDLVTQEQVWAEAPEGIWIFSSAAYPHASRGELTIPSDFQQRSATCFEQDKHWELRIQVRHYRRE